MGEDCHNFNRRVSDARLERMEIRLEQIFGVLNGPDGVVTKVEVLDEKMKGIPSPETIKFHASIGGGLVLFLALLGYIIIRLIKD